MAKRQILRDAIGVGGVNDDAFAETSATFRILRLKQVAPAGSRPQHLAARRDFETLGYRFPCFNAFRTTHNSILYVEKSAQYRNTREPKQGVFDGF